MSKNPEIDAIRMEENKERILKLSFKLLAERGIEAVSMSNIAKAARFDRSSLYRYFQTKQDLVIAINAYVWGRFTARNYERPGVETQTAAQRYVFWLDSFLVLYREYGDILRFNQFFNVYIANERVSAEQMAPFHRVIKELEARFHEVYALAKKDGTLRTDIPEQKIFSTTLHLMLAAATRYAVGLVYQGADSSPEEELTALREMLMERYVAGKQSQCPADLSENTAMHPLDTGEGII